MSPPKKNLQLQLHRSNCWKKKSPLFLTLYGENASRFNGESRRWDLTWSFVGIFFRGKSLKVGTEFWKPTLFFWGKKSDSSPAISSTDPWFFFMVGGTEKKRRYFLKYGDVLHEHFQGILSCLIFFDFLVSYIKTLNLRILEFVWSLTWAPKIKVCLEFRSLGSPTAKSPTVHGSVSSIWKNLDDQGVVKEIQELKSRWHSLYILVHKDPLPTYLLVSVPSILTLR